MAKLAIKSHATRGKEVIEILKMLGGRTAGYSGLGSQYYYYIDECGNITGTTELSNCETFVTYTLEQFLEKFPHKVGDEVLIDNEICTITRAVWDISRVVYKVNNNDYDIFVVEQLQSYKEEIKVELKLNSVKNNMEWNYKNVIISIESDGKFYFSVNGKVNVENTLESAKYRIDELLKDYYTFNEKDIDKLCKKLDKRESDFVRALIEELKLHEFNAYCEIGISDEMLFKF